MSTQFKTAKPTKEEAEEAVRTLIRWAGDDPMRTGLLDTPKRVIESYNEFFSGYNTEIDAEIDKTFDMVDGYEEMIILNNVRLESHCEHHMVPIIGHASVAYIPNQRIIGISKIARVINIFAKRLQIQERLVVEIARCIEEIVQPKGVGVVIESAHHCLTTRGVHKPGSSMQTSHMLGCFKEQSIKKEFFKQVMK